MSAMRSLESILEHGSRDSTYKFALISAIIDYLIEHPAQIPKNYWHFIPLWYVVLQFIGYYHPLILLKIPQGPQRTGRNRIALEGYFEHFFTSVHGLDFDPRIPENANKLWSMIRTNPTLDAAMERLLRETRNLIVDQPLRYVQNVKGERISFFSLLTRGVPMTADFEMHLKKASMPSRELTKLRPLNWNKLLTREKSYIVLSHNDYAELSTYRFWLKDAVIKRWAEECVTRFGASDTRLLTVLDFWKKQPERDSKIIKKYKALYSKLNFSRCLYCQVDLTPSKFVLDHFIPWARYPVNAFWNLYPACSNCNQEKSDSLPVINDELRDRIKDHLTGVISYYGGEGSDDKGFREIVLNDLLMFYQEKVGKEISSVGKVDQEETVLAIMGFLMAVLSDLAKIIPGKRFTL